MSNYNSQLQSNNTDLQAILNSINELPEAGGGIELPTLTNEGSASDLLSGKQLIGQDGNAITGTFSIDNELSTQDNLIAQIQAAVDSLPEAGGSSSGSASYDTCTLQINNQDGFSYLLAYTSVENGKIVAKYSNISDYSTSITCLCGSTLCCYLTGSFTSTSLTMLGYMDAGSYFCNAYRVDASANETITATVSFGGGSSN